MIVGTNAVEQALFTHREYWREKHQDRVVDQLIEEMSELTKALLKKRRGFDVPDDDVKGEIADVCICLEFLGQGLGFENEELRVRVGKIAGDLEFKLEKLRWERDGSGGPP